MLLRYLAHDVGTVAELMRVERLAGFSLVPDATQSLVDLFLDAEPFPLLKACFALRLRQHDGAFYGRLRPLEAPLGERSSAHRQVVPCSLPLPLRAADLAPGALQSALQALVGTVPLDLQARVRIERTPRTLQWDGQSVGSLVVDRVVYEWARELDAVHEVKMLLRGRIPHDLERLDAVLHAYGLQPLDPDRYASVVQRLGAPVTAPLLLMPRERRQLRLLADGAGLVARRAQAILAVADRRATAEVARTVGMEPGRVRFWSERFRWYRLRLFEEGRTHGQVAPTRARPYARDEIALDGVRSDSETKVAMTLPSTARETPARTAAPPRPPRDPEPATSTDSREGTRRPAQTPLLEAKGAQGRDLRAGVLTRVARVVAHRSRSARDRRRPAADLATTAEQVSHFTHDLDAPLASCLEEDLSTAWSDLHDELARLRAAHLEPERTADRSGGVSPVVAIDSSVVALDEAVRRFDGVVACYGVNAEALWSVTEQSLDVFRARIARARAWEAIGQLLPVDMEVVGTALSDEVRARFVQERLQIAGYDLPERCDVESVTAAQTTPQPPLRLVLASTVWRQYERLRPHMNAVDLALPNVEVVTASTSTLQVLAGLRHALRRAVNGHGGAHAELRLLEHALQRGRVSTVLAEARTALDVCDVDPADAGRHRVLLQRLEAARREEAAAWHGAARDVLGRPFRNYLGIVVAAL